MSMPFQKTAKIRIKNYNKRPRNYLLDAKIFILSHQQEGYLTEESENFPKNTNQKCYFRLYNYYKKLFVFPKNLKNLFKTKGNILLLKGNILLLYK